MAVIDIADPFAPVERTLTAPTEYCARCGGALVVGIVWMWVNGTGPYHQSCAPRPDQELGDER